MTSGAGGELSAGSSELRHASRIGESACAFRAICPRRDVPGLMAAAPDGQRIEFLALQLAATLAPDVLTHPAEAEGL